MDNSHGDLSDKAGAPRAPLRVMQILSELARFPEGASLAWLSERLDLPKTSLFSLLRSLEAGGYVVSENGHHRLGPVTFALASAIFQQNGLAARVKAVTQWLRAQAGETIMLAIPAADWSHLVIVDVLESQSSLRFTATVGDTRPLYSTSIGMALLAHAPPEQRRNYLLTTNLVALTPDTITSANALERALGDVRTLGYAIGSGSVEGATALAAPVFGAQGILASVSIAGPSSRIQARVDAMRRLVIEAGRQMSELLGDTERYSRFPRR